MREWWREKQPLDTLHVSWDEYFSIVKQLGLGNDDFRGAEQRRYQRFNYWRKEVRVLMYRQAASNVPYLVRPHNLSARGIAFLHGFFVQMGTRCDTALWTFEREPLVVPGQVMRCRYFGGKTHEIGVEFDHLIDLRKFVGDQSSMDDSESEGQWLTRYTGRLLCVDDCDDDRELVEFMARELGLEVKAVSDSREALVAAKESAVDLIVLKIDMVATDGTSLVALLRRRGFEGFIAGVVGPNDGAADEGEREAAALREGCNCVLRTPITVERFHDLLSSVLPRACDDAEDVEPLVSSRWSNVRMRPVILKFVARLETRLAELQGLLRQSDKQDFRRACAQFVGSAENYGYEALAAVVRELESLVQAGHTAKLAEKMSELTRLCTAARRVHQERR